jgi:hypothetical protein
MRKQLLALLSALGLAGSSSPAKAQTPQGSPPANTKSESTVKVSKATQEDAASKDAAKMTKLESERKAGGIQVDDKRKIGKSQQEGTAAEAKAKIKLQSAEGGHATSDVVNEKLRKAGAEQNATGLEHKHKQTAAEKTAVSQELTRKDKWRKAQSETSASSAQIKGEKSSAEANAQGSELAIKKQQKVAAGAAAAQSDANKKANQASPK